LGVQMLLAEVDIVKGIGTIAIPARLPYRALGKHTAGQHQQH